MLKKCALWCLSVVSLGLWGGESDFVENVRTLLPWRTVKKREHVLPTPLPFKGIIFDCPGGLVVEEGPEFQVRCGSRSKNPLHCREFVADSPFLIIKSDSVAEWGIVLPFNSSKVFGLLRVNRGNVVISQKHLRLPIEVSVADWGTLSIEGGIKSHIMRSFSRAEISRCLVLHGTDLRSRAVLPRRSQSQQELRQELQVAKLSRASTAP